MYLLTIIILILGIADFLTKQQAISFSKEEKSSNLMRIGIHYKIVSLLLFFALHGIDLVINENFLKAIGVSFVSSEIGSIGIISTIYFLGIINYELVSIKENYKQMGIDANYLNPIIGLFKIFNTRIINKIKGKQEKKEK